MTTIERYFKPVILIVISAAVCSMILQVYRNGSPQNWRDFLERKDLPAALQNVDRYKMNKNSINPLQIYREMWDTKPTDDKKEMFPADSDDKQNHDKSSLTRNSFSISKKKRKKVIFADRGWSYKGPDTRRCRVQTIGCYQPSPNNATKSFKILIDSSPNMTDSYCILLCSKRMRGKFVFAGLRNGNECRCASLVKYLIQLEESNKCNVPCAGDKTRKCGGRRDITMVYLIKSECTAAPPLSDVVTASSVIGCYSKPKNLVDSMEEYFAENEWEAARCVLQCESVGLVLAIPIYPNACYCGLTSSRFNLSQSVDMSMCSRNKNNNFVAVYRTNSEDRRCEKRRFLKKGELGKKVGLITFPGSGNTWLRYLIESVTGIYTGSVYGDPSLQNGGYLGENLPPDSYKVAVIKSHRQGHIYRSKYLEAFINVYRNPYDALLSEYNRRKEGHTGSINDEKFKVEELTKLSTGGMAEKWRLVTKFALDSPAEKLIFSYDDLVNDPLLYAEKMARFIMGNDLDEKELKNRLLCMLLSKTGEFKRKKKTLNFDPFSNEAKRRINEQIVNLANDIEKVGLKPIIDYRRPITEA